jgi:hypothetical protein
MASSFIAYIDESGDRVLTLVRSVEGKRLTVEPYSAG